MNDRIIISFLFLYYYLLHLFGFYRRKHKEDEANLQKFGKYAHHLLTECDIQLETVSGSTACQINLASSDLDYAFYLTKHIDAETILLNNGFEKESGNHTHYVDYVNKKQQLFENIVLNVKLYKNKDDVSNIKSGIEKYLKQSTLTERCWMLAEKHYYEKIGDLKKYTDAKYSLYYKYGICEKKN